MVRAATTGVATVPMTVGARTTVARRHPATTAAATARTTVVLPRLVAMTVALRHRATTGVATGPTSADRPRVGEPTGEAIALMTVVPPAVAVTIVRLVVTTAAGTVPMIVEDPMTVALPWSVMTGAVTVPMTVAPPQRAVMTDVPRHPVMTAVATVPMTAAPPVADVTTGAGTARTTEGHRRVVVTVGAAIALTIAPVAVPVDLRGPSSVAAPA